MGWKVAGFICRNSLSAHPTDTLERWQWLSLGGWQGLSLGGQQGLSLRGRLLSGRSSSAIACSSSGSQQSSLKDHLMSLTSRSFSLSNSLISCRPQQRDPYISRGTISATLSTQLHTFFCRVISKLDILIECSRGEDREGARRRAICWLRMFRWTGYRVVRYSMHAASSLDTAVSISWSVCWQSCSFRQDASISTGRDRGRGRKGSLLLGLSAPLATHIWFYLFALDVLYPSRITFLPFSFKSFSAVLPYNALIFTSSRVLSSLNLSFSALRSASFLFNTCWSSVQLWWLVLRKLQLFPFYRDAFEKQALSLCLGDLQG